MTMKDPTTFPTPSGRWPPLLASWALMSMRSRRPGLDERTFGLLTTWQKVPQRTSVLLGGASHQIAQDHGLKGNPFPCGSEVVRWSVLLTVVWERRTEWRHGGEPPIHQPLPPQPCLRLMPRVLNNQCQSYAPPPCSCVNWHQPVSTTMMTERRNLILMIMARMMMTPHSARISTTPSTSCCQQSGGHYHSTLVFTAGQASLASPG